MKISGLEVCKIKILSAIGIVSGIFFVVAYFGGGFLNAAVMQNAASCLFGGGVDNLPHSYHCITSDKFLLIAIFAIVIATFVLAKVAFPSKSVTFFRNAMTPAGSLIAISVAAGLIGIFLINQKDLVMFKGLLFSSDMGQNLINGLSVQKFSLIISFFVVAIRTLLKVSLLYVLIFAYRNAGKLFFTMAVPSEESKEFSCLSEIIYIALGLGIHGLLLVALSLFGFLNSPTAWLLLCLLFVCGFYQKNQRADFWRALFSPISNLTTFSFVALVAWASLNLIKITRPIPTGFDDMNLYINYGKNLYETGSLPQGFGMRFWEVFTSQGFFLLGGTANAELTILLSFFGGFLALVALFLLLKHFWPTEQTSFGLLLLIFYTTPIVFFQMAKDMKTDVALTFFFIASISAFLIIFEKARSREQNEKILLPYLSLLGLFLGISFSLKYTAGFFIVPIAILTILVLWQNKKITAILVMAAIFSFLIPFLPWFVKDYRETGSFQLQSLLSWQQPSGARALAVDQLASKYPEFSVVKDKAGKNFSLIPSVPVNIGSGYDEEVQRYAGYESGLWRGYLLRPWYIHLNNKVRGVYVDIGYMWLAGLALFLPIIWLFKKDERFNILGAITVIYWCLWVFIGKGIPWYGLPGFILILLLFGRWYEQSQKISKIVPIFFISLSVFWVMIVSLTELSAFFNPFVLGYASGYLDTQSATEQLVSWYYAIGHEVNNNPPSVGHPNYVYRVDTAVSYFIENDFTRIYNDPLLNTFTLLNSEANQYLTTLRLALLGFRYLVIDLRLATIDQTPDKTLVTKVGRLTKYIDGNPYLLDRVKSDRGGVIFLEIDPKLTSLYRN